MRGATTAIFLALCALALGGCVTGQGRPPSNHAYLDMYDRPPARARKAQASVRASKPPESTTTVGSAAPATTLRPYSPEWWEVERAREKSENERLKRVMQICRGC